MNFHTTLIRLEILDLVQTTSLLLISNSSNFISHLDLRRRWTILRLSSFKIISACVFFTHIESLQFQNINEYLMEASITPLRWYLHLDFKKIFIIISWLFAYLLWFKFYNKFFEPPAKGYYITLAFLRFSKMMI